MKGWLRFKGLWGAAEVSPDAKLCAIAPAEYGTDIHLEGSVVAVRNPPEEVEAAFTSLWNARAEELSRAISRRMRASLGGSPRKREAGCYGGPYR